MGIIDAAYSTLPDGHTLSLQSASSCIRISYAGYSEPTAPPGYYYATAGFPSCAYSLPAAVAPSWGEIRARYRAFVYGGADRYPARLLGPGRPAAAASTRRQRAPAPPMSAKPPSAGTRALRRQVRALLSRR